MKLGHKLCRNHYRIKPRILEPFVVMIVIMSMGVSVELALLVVGNVLISDEDTRSVGVQIVGHIVTLLLHIVTELVEGRGTDQVALTIDLPSDRSVLGADFVVTASSGGGSSVVVDILSVLTVLDPSSDHIRVEVRFVVDNGEDLSLDTNSRGNILRSKSGEDIKRELAENTIVERSLVLVDFSAGTGSRVRPVDLVGLSNNHSLAVLPFVRSGELGVFFVVVVATESTTDFLFGEVALRSRGVSVRAASELVVLSNRVVLSTQMPVDIDGTHFALPVLGSVGDNTDIHATDVSLGDVSTSLRTRKMDAVNIFELGVHASARVLSLAEDGGNIRSDVVRDVRHDGLHGDGFGGIAHGVVGGGKGNGSSEKTNGGDDKDSKGTLELHDLTALVNSRGFGGGFFLGRHG